MTVLPAVAAPWHIRGAADFNGDGYANLVWQNNTSGARTIWLMKNGVSIGSMALPTVSTAWNIVEH